MTPYHLKVQLNQDSASNVSQNALPSNALDGTVNQSTNNPEAAPRVFQGSKPALRNWRISSPPANGEQSPSMDSFDDEDVFGSSKNRAASVQAKTPTALKVAHGIGVFATTAWLAYAVSYLFKIQGGIATIFASPFTLGGIVAGVLAPVALIWIALASWQRRSDAALYAEALRGELQSLLFPTQDQAHKVNSDIQLLVAQAVEMSSSSRAAIKAIQRARHGLRSEIRDFVGVSQKTEFHIDRLSETLNSRAEQLLSLTQKIEERAQSIHKGSTEGVAVWTEATNKMLEKANQTSEHVDTVADKIARAQQNLSSQAILLSEAGNRIASESQNFEQTVAANIARFESLTTQSKESLSSVQSLALDQEKALTNLVARNEQVHEKISIQSDVLNKAVAELSQKTSDLDAVGQTASHKLGEALSMALSGSDAITAAVRKTREQIERAVGDANQSSASMISTAEQKIQNMVAAAADQFARLEAMLTSFEKREQDLRTIIERLGEQNQSLVTSTDMSVAKLDEASNRLNNTTTNLKDKVAEPLQAIETTTSMLSARAADVQRTLSDKIADVEQAAHMANEKANMIAAQVKAEVSNIASVTGQLLAHAQGLESTLETHKEKFTSFVDSTESRMDTMVARAKDQSNSISNAAFQTGENLERISTTLIKVSEESVVRARSTVDEMRIMEQSVLDQLLALAAQSAQTQITLQNMELTLRDTAKSTMPVLDDAVAKADIAQSRLHALRGDYEVTSDQILTRLTGVNATLVSSLTDINDKAQSVSRNINNITHDLRDAVTSIEGAANQADQTLLNLQSGLKGQTDHLHILSDQAQLKVEALQKLFTQNTDQINIALGKAVSQIEDVTTKFGGAAEAIELRADQSTEKMNNVTRKYQDESQRMVNLAEDQAQKSMQLLHSIKDQTVTLSDQSQKALLDLQRANDSIAVRVREVDEYMKAALKNTQNYNDDLRAQAQLVSRVSAETVDEMAAQISRLSLKADEAKDIGNRLVQAVDVSRTKLSDETERLNSVARKAVDTADEAASAFARQSVTLYKAVQDVAVYAERVKETQVRGQRDQFLSSAKFVVESLHSLAVDVARHLETDVDDRLWRQYQNGDTSSFTRRLMELSPNVDMQRAQKKFAEDGEFRNYVQRFIRQFEELFEQAQSNDHGNLLATTFSTSHIGRVYALLCDISGRGSKLN